MNTQSTTDRGAFASIIIATALAAVPNLVAAQEAATNHSTKAPIAGTFLHEGTVVQAKDGKLRMTIRGGVPHTHKIASDAEITVDGRPAALTDLQQGDQVKVASRVLIQHRGSRAMLSINGPAIAIEATRPPKPRGDEATTARRDSDPALGVLVAASPGGSPLVLGVAEGSVAESAGLRQGDYLIAVDGSKLSSVQELQKAISQAADRGAAKLDIWRQGQELSLGAKFPTSEQADEKSNKQLAGEPWLGLMLTAADEVAGAKVSRVVLRSPAAKAGLRSGDVITKIDGQPVESPEQFAAVAKEANPGQEMEIAVRRGDQEEPQVLTVNVGDLADFHERLFGKDFRRRFEDFHELLDPDFDGVPEPLERQSESSTNRSDRF